MRSGSWDKKFTEEARRTWGNYMLILRINFYTQITRQKRVAIEQSDVKEKE